METKSESTGTSSLDLYIYNDVEPAGWFSDGECSADYFRQELAKFPNVSNINVYINSLGGDVMEGVAIYNQLKRHTAKKTVYIDGFACSIASVIAMAGDTVIMPENAVMMIHHPWTVAVGNAAELRKTADDLDKICEAVRQSYLVRAGDKLTEEKLQSLLDGETYLTSAECIELGLADVTELSKEEEPDEDEQEKLKEQAKEQALKEALQKRRDNALAAVVAINKYFS